jgi:hypothetical protein
LGLGLSREEPSEDAFDEAVKLHWLVQVFDHDPFDEGDAGVLKLPVSGLVGGGAAAVGDDKVGPEGALAGAEPGAGQDPDRGLLGTALLGTDERLVHA